jgi:hypothetical protein
MPNLGLIKKFGSLYKTHTYTSALGPTLSARCMSSVEVAGLVLGPRGPPKPKHEVLLYGSAINSMTKEGLWSQYIVQL